MEIQKKLYSNMDVNMDDLLKRTALSKIIDEITCTNSRLDSHKKIYDMMQYMNVKLILIDLLLEDKELQKKFLVKYAK